VTQYEDAIGLPGAVRQVLASINPGRVSARLEALAQIGAQPGGGVTCPGFSDEEAEANALFSTWMREAGLTVARDQIGNLFGSTDGNQPGVSPFAAGSHLDTVPNGGKYDGRLGLLAALETIEALRTSGIELTHPLELTVWRCEEPSRFPAGRIGSQFFAGELTVDELLPMGKTFGLGARLADEATSDLPLRASGRPLAGYLELHIEQGRRLEDAGRQIGIVSAIAAATRVRIIIEGVADHSGATPMGLRHDALCAAAELILATERAGRARAANDIVATAVRIGAEPGALNVVPGYVELWLDVRGTDAILVTATIEEVRVAGQQIAEARGVTIIFEQNAAGTPVIFPEAVVTVLDRSALALGYTTLILPSGAGHDAQTIAPLAPSGMIFVPSVAGISHAPAEYTTSEAIDRGVRTLATAWISQALDLA
jgi:hydantoinase/carbamoylase family amidase